ncbi:MAG: hypothetical protein WD689_04590 [Gaiellaceae bacterium]
MSPKAASILVCAAAIAAGCGGGGDRLTEELLRERANEICAGLAAQLDAIGEPTNLAEARDLLEEGQRLLDDALAQLRQLEPPANLEAEYDRFLETGDQAVERLGEMSSAADAEDVEELDRLGELAAQEDEEADEIARGLGFDDCATA